MNARANRRPAPSQPLVRNLRIGLFLLLLSLSALPLAAQTLRLASLSGNPGGRVHLSLRSEPKTLNPAFATDVSSRIATTLMHADLLHINRQTDLVEPALASSWQSSRGGTRYTLHLRHNVRFSDGAPFTADDVVFSFQIYLDPALNAPQRELLIIDGHPIQVTKLDPFTVQFDLARPYAAAARLFDGLAILPSHLLDATRQANTFKDSWTIATPASQIAGLGPFRLKSYRPGQALVYERNPYYWKQDSVSRPLPYLNEVDFEILPNQDAESLRFSAGQLDLLARLSPDAWDSMQKQLSDKPSAKADTSDYRMIEGGSALEFNFLLFNLNSDVPGHLPEAAHAQKWFLQPAFRQALSLAVNRDVIVRLAFQNHAEPLASPVTSASRQWADPKIKMEKPDIRRARALLASAGFHWKGETLLDRSGDEVKFTILASSSNRQRTEIASLLRRDFATVGIDAQVVSLETRSFLDRVTKTHDYDTAVMGLSAGDTEPNGNLSLWLSDGSLHLWSLAPPHPASPWEQQIDSAMRQQLYTPEPAARHSLYNQVQQIYSAQLPFLSLASPHLLGAVRTGLSGVSIGPLNANMLDNIDTWSWKN